MQIKKIHYADLIFVAMVFISLLVTYLFYISWNRPNLPLSPLSGNQLENYSIDSCMFGEKEIMVKGWAFVKENPKILNRVYAVRDDGIRVEVLASIQKRKDVSKAFDAGVMYDSSGFIARRREAGANKNFTGEIVLLSMDENGAVNAAEYTCK